MEAETRAPPAGKTKSLVTGGNGFIGRYLCRALLARGDEVTVIDNLSGSREQDIEPGVLFIKGTTSDASLMEATIQGMRNVYHLAAITGHIVTSRDPKYIYDDTVAGATNLANSVSNNQNVWAFSSAAVFGGGIIVNANESRQLFSLSYDGYRLGFAAGKARLENICLSAGKGIHIVRPFSIVGPGQTGRYGRVLPMFVGRGLLKLPITIYDDGDAVRSYGDVETFVNCLLRISGTTSVVNIGSEQALSVNILAGLIERELSLHFDIKRVTYHVHFHKEDVVFRTPDISLLRSIIGNIEWKDINDNIKEVADWMRAMDQETLSYHTNLHSGG